jgi:hypothetical protein
MRCPALTKRGSPLPLLVNSALKIAYDNKDINAIDTGRVRTHTLIGKRRKSNLKGIGDGFPKLPRRYLESVPLPGWRIRAFRCSKDLERPGLAATKASAEWRLEDGAKKNYS